MTVIHIKTGCPQGHPYTEKNSYIDKDGYRHCKTCRLERMRDRRKDNVRVGRGVNNASKTECPKGHPYDEENTITYVKPNGRFARHCRACERLNSKVQNVKRYGISIERFNEMLILQDSRCTICKGKFWEEVSSPHIDHDHSCCNGQMRSCGKCVRDLLCRSCNQLLGVSHEDTKILKAAIAYIEANTN
jgi:hypothetical protein